MLAQVEAAQANPLEITLPIETVDAFVPLIGNARYKGAHGGRGSGKSHFFAQHLIDECMAVKGTRAVCLREVLKSLEFSSKTLIEDKIKAMGVGWAFNVTKTHIETIGGGVILFQGMQNHTAETIRSLEGCRIAWFDEAHRASKISLDLLRPTLFRVKNSQFWASWNPKSKDDPVDKLFRDDPPPGTKCIEVNFDDNFWFPPGLKEEMEYDRRRDPEKYKHVWLGMYQTRSEARVFHNWKIEEFETPPDTVFLHGCDWGFAKDPTVLVRAFVAGRKLYVDREAWQVGCEIDATPDLFDKLDPDHPRAARNWRIVADSSNPQSISYMRRFGYQKLQPAVKGPKSVEEGIEFLKGYDIVVHPRCRHVADELATYSYHIDKLTDQVLPKLKDAKNHTIDSLRYAAELIRRKPIPGGYGAY